MEDWHRDIYKYSGAWMDLNSLPDFEHVLHEMDDTTYVLYIDAWLASIRFVQYKEFGFSIGTLCLSTLSRKERLIWAPKHPV